MRCLRPFFSYYGAKWRLSRHYAPPMHQDILEPFAGSACYALHYPDRRVVLCDLDPVICGIWRYLIGVRESEVLGLPDLVESIDDLPPTIGQEAKHLIGFWLLRCGKSPGRTSAPWKKALSRNAEFLRAFWGPEIKVRVASQLRHIRHWRIVEGSYEKLPDTVGTWFIDPPYQGVPGSGYRCGSAKIDYAALGKWCLSRRGQVIVCESQDAGWLPFRPLTKTRSIRKKLSGEAVWENAQGAGQQSLF